MNQNSINYFLNQSTVKFFSFEKGELIAEMLLVSSVLAKTGKLSARLATFFYDDLKICLKLAGIDSVEENEISTSTHGNHLEEAYKAFKTFLSAQNDKDDDMAALFDSAMKLTDSRKSSIYLFRENIVTDAVTDWIKVGSADYKTCYCPFNNLLSAEENLASPSVKVFAPFMHKSGLLLKALLQLAAGKSEFIDFSLTGYESVFSDITSEYDCGFCCGPMGYRLDNGTYKPVEVALIDDMVNKVSGRFAVVVPVNYGTASMHSFLQNRRTIVESGRLKATILLPGGFLVGSLVNTLILLFDKKNANHQQISLIDLTKDVCLDKAKSGRQRIALNEYAKNQVIAVLQDKSSDLALNVDIKIIKNDEYNLMPNRYMAAAQINTTSDLGERAVKLADIANIYRAQASKKEETGSSYFEIGAADINASGIVEQPTKEILIGKESSTLKNLVHKGDIILAIKGSVGKVGIITKEHPNWLAGQSFVILRIKEECADWTPDFLFWQLKSKKINQFLKNVATGALIQLLKMDDVKNLKLLPPAKELQEKIVNAQKKKLEIIAKIKELTKELEELENLI